MISLSGNELKALFLTPGPWLNKTRGPILASAIGILLACLAITLGLVPVRQSTPIQWPKVICLVASPLFFFLLWLILTQIYLRSGRGIKIGLAYDGHKVSIEEWKRTAAVFQDLLRNTPIKKRISLRFTPNGLSTNAERRTSFMKRYSFSILTTATHSPSLSNPERNQDRFPYTLTIANGSFKTELLRTHFKATFSPLYNRNFTNLFNLLDAQAHSLHDALLFLAAGYYFSTEQYNDASLLLRHLDNSLEQSTSPDHSPRLNIRYLDMQSCLAPTKFAIEDIPPIEELHRLVPHVERAHIYANQFVEVALNLARFRFLVGNIEGAVELTELAVSKMRKGILPGEGHNQRFFCANFWLNKGFLMFMQSRWTNSAKAFSEMLAIPAYRKINWSALVYFIDHVATFDHEGIVYCQVLYRHLAGVPVKGDLAQRVEAWLSDDDSRQSLVSLLRTVTLSRIKKQPVKKNSQKRKSTRKKQSKRR